MSVRRLADELIQPAAFAFPAENQAWAEKIIARYPAGRQQSAVDPDPAGGRRSRKAGSPAPAIEAVANMLGMAYIRVLEVATFYTQFQLKPVGSRMPTSWSAARRPACCAAPETCIDVCQHKIAHDPLEVSADGKLSWEEVECLGACVNAPMIMIGNDTYEDLTAERFEEIVEAFPRRQWQVRSSRHADRAPVLRRRKAARRRCSSSRPPSAPTSRSRRRPRRRPLRQRRRQPPLLLQRRRRRQRPLCRRPPVRAEQPDRRGESRRRSRAPRQPPKVSEAKAEGERAKANAGAKADGEPNKAMREDATGRGIAGRASSTAASPQPRKRRASCSMRRPVRRTISP